MVDKIIQILRISKDDIVGNIGSPSDPHNHNYEELIIGVEGMLHHFIDFKDQTIIAPFVSFVSKGKMHRLIPQLYNGQCDMWVIRFKSEFIAETTFQLYAYYHDQANVKLNDGYCFKRFSMLCDMMYEEQNKELPNYAILKQCLTLLFTVVESERKNNEPKLDNNKSNHTSFKQFLSLLEEHYKSAASVEFYAEQLYMTPRNLNIICQNIMEQSTSEIIETRKLIEAKNLLISTNMSIAEIGFSLGYKEKSYFSTVFRKKAGQSPSDFREEIKKLLKS